MSVETETPTLTKEQAKERMRQMAEESAASAKAAASAEPGISDLLDGTDSEFEPANFRGFQLLERIREKTSYADGISDKEQVALFLWILDAQKTKRKTQEARAVIRGGIVALDDAIEPYLERLHPLPFEQIADIAVKAAAAFGVTVTEKPEGAQEGNEPGPETSGEPSANSSA